MSALLRLKEEFKKHGMEIQFWAYETGNMVAAIHGSGGFEKFWDVVSTEPVQELMANYPDVAVVVGIGGVAVVAPVARKAIESCHQTVLNIYDSGVTAGAVGLLGYAVSQDTSWITTSASSFVVGSSFLKYAMNNPFFLKLGGLALAGGGVCLAAFGIDSGLQTIQADDVDNVKLALNGLTFLTGAYVTSASLLTYEGGIYETLDYKDEKEELKGVRRFIHPTRGGLAKIFKASLDAPIQWVNDKAKQTMLRYIPSSIRNDKPFLTSAWARAPWRVVTAAVAVATGEYAFAAANGGWFVGDTAIGSLDWEDEKPAP